MDAIKAHKLAFVYHSPFWLEKGRVVTGHPAIGRYVDALAPYFSEIILIVPGHDQIDSVQYSLESSNVALLPLPHYHNIQGFWFYAPVYLWILLQSAKSWDLLNIRMPTHLGFLAFLAAKFWRKKNFLVVVGEFFPYNSLSNYPYLKQKIVNADCTIQDKLMAFMIKRSLAFTNGEDLFKKFQQDNKALFLMRSSTINLEDINTKKDRAILHRPVRIITVAVISPGKGTSLIPDIIHNLNLMGYEIEWHLLGRVDGAAGEKEFQLTLAQASGLSVSSQLTFHGQKSWHELKEHYHNSDLFVLPTYVEGIPRVLLEAQAAGLPIVTTTVGGIPKAVTNGHNGILVPPGEPLLMAQAIGNIIRHERLYHHLMMNGFESARQSSLENETLRMLQRVGEELNVSFATTDG